MGGFGRKLLCGRFGTGGGRGSRVVSGARGVGSVSGGGDEVRKRPRKRGRWIGDGGMVGGRGDRAVWRVDEGGRGRG